ncbi:rRNA accumulation-related protein [Stygiomarasmius scandens]|uniref:rRNA accumulation-related protein n=1 Tax=Marasmiellus scandens TaxID=2682957 RepID=A0ABR1ISX8_9AGAR
MDVDTPRPSSVLFARGVIARLAIWSTLRVAVLESWGGPGAAEKRTWLAGVIVDTFEEQSPPPDDQYIEELLLQVMQDEYEVSVEDGSAESVAVDIVRIWEEVSSGKQELVVKFEDLADKLKDKKPMVETQAEGDEEDWEDDGDDESGDDEEGEDEDEPVPQLIERPKKNEPEVDEDGFTLVKKNRR